MLRNHYCLFILFFVTTFSCDAQDYLFDKLEGNIKEAYLTQGNRRQDLNAVVRQFEIDHGHTLSMGTVGDQKIASDSAVVKKLMTTIGENGAWDDLNYQDDRWSGWDPAVHAERVLMLTVLYFQPGQKYFKNEVLKKVIHCALQYWFISKPQCKNWWFNEIGIPRMLGPVFIFLKSELSPMEFTRAIELMNKSTFKQTGQNKVWQAGNILLKAILIKDAALVKRARDTIFSELKVSKDEGIKADFSFHQHGPQQQIGNYGLAFLNSMASWSRVFVHTPLAIDDEKLRILKQLIFNGFSWSSWNGYFDINSLGRQLFKNAQRDKSLDVAYSMLDMTFVDPGHREDYLRFVVDNYSKFADKQVGTRHFWLSDLTIHRSFNWCSSIKMSSDRVQATETGNGENLQGYHIGDGTTFIEVDGNEYDNIFPFWDWKKLPGVTNVQSEQPLPILSWTGFRNKGLYTGGVMSGATGISAFQLNRDSLTANKSWFYIDDVMVCLGSAIHSQLENKNICTTINQTKLEGVVNFYTGKEQQLAKGSSLTSRDFKWIYHNKVGYYFLQPENVNVVSKTQSGRWNNVASFYANTADLQRDIFTVEIKHDSSLKFNSYVYVILPGISLEKLKVYQPGFKIARNGSEAQVIVNNTKTTMWLAVYQPTEIRETGFPSVKIKQPGLYILEKDRQKWRLSIAEPTQKLNKVTVEIDGKSLSITLPGGVEAGKTTSVNFITN